MTRELDGLRIAVLATDGVEQVELIEPVKALLDAGATVDVVAPQPDTIEGWNHHDRGDLIPVDVPLDHAEPGGYDGLVLPGGVINPDALRMNRAAVAFVRSFVDRGMPIAAICHGPWTLIEANGVQGRRMTSWPSLKTDLTNAGATWVDEPVATDRGLVTSRRPDDLGAFCEKMVEEFHEGAHRRRAAE